MSELTLKQIHRLDRALLLRERANKRKLSQTIRRTDRILVMFGLSVAAIIMAAVLATNLEWQPGNQDAIAKRYRPLKHDAVSVAAK